jgi:diguanylate cyclase (GGDEF)-like protein
MKSESHTQSLETLISDLEHAYNLRAEDPERCLHLSKTLFAQAETLQLLRPQALALRNIGVAQFLRSEYVAALGSLLQGAALAREIEDLSCLRDCLNFSGAVYVSLGDVPLAIESVQATLELDERSQHRNGIASGLNNLGILHIKLGRYAQALEYLGQAIQLATQLGDTQRQLEATANLGLAQMGNDQLEQALASFEAANALAELTGDRVLAARNLANLAEALTKLGRYEAALEINNQALTRAQAFGNQESEAYCLLNAGRIHLKANDPHRAVITLEHALVLAQEFGSQDLVFKVHQMLADAFERADNLRSALDHTREYQRLESKFRDSESERRVQAFAVRHDLDRARNQAEIERLKSVELAGLLETLRSLDREKDQLLEKLREQSRELEKQVVTDPLTNIFNRRHLEAVLREEFVKANRNKMPLPVAVMDIDSFKRVNDTFGHALGDLVLQTVAQIMLAQVRPGDLLARYGGEEFVMALPRSSQEQAVQICERMRLAIAEHDWASLHPQLQITVSIGLSCDPGAKNHEHLLSLADQKLYLAKDAGRNCLRF